MPKDSHSARRQDAKLLSLLADVSYSEAVQRLDGARGAELADESRCLVEELHQAARARADVSGQSVRSAKSTLLCERGLLPADSAFPVLHADTYEWSELHGAHVKCERQLADVTRALTGVVLPPQAGQPEYRLRCVLTSPARGRQLGEVVTLDGRRWSFDLSPMQVGAPRRARCSADRPVYTSLTLPTDILVPVSTLRRRRLIPARTQAPIATLRSLAGRTMPLYAATDAVPIPATTPQQAKAILRSRTCSTCGITSSEPFRIARDGRHYCTAHFDAAMKCVENAERARGRAVSTLWAQQVRRDPSAVLLMLCTNDGSLTVRMEAIEGAVIINEVVPLADIPSQMDVLFDEVRPDQLPAWVGAAVDNGWLGRRLIAAVTRGADEKLVLLMNGFDRGRRRSSCGRSDWQDQLYRRYGIWNGDVRPEPGRFEFLEPEYLDSGIRRRKRTKEFDPAGVIAEMRAMLAAMADETLTEAETDHAERYLAKERGPGRSPFDRRSDRAPLASGLMRVFGAKRATSD
ncbi:hypothetical protein [Amycolatopsis speibonae]|uniref:Recombinase domain-containing protein n=1 Tax=Amycolatopsis speibonae TaxID=1450224 RepID=A0ABV7P0W4_9PSEU